MLQQALNIKTNLRIAPESTWFDDATSGNFDILIGVARRVRLFPRLVQADGPQNYAFWNNSRFDETLLKIDREVDRTQRLTHIRAAEELMEDDPPLLPMVWVKINDAWYNYVKGLKPQEYFCLYDVNRYDVVRLEK